MEGPRDDHTNKVIQRKAIYDAIHMESLMFNNDTNELVYRKRNRLTDIGNKLMVTKGEMCVQGGGMSQELGMNTHTLLCIPCIRQVTN